MNSEELRQLYAQHREIAVSIERDREWGFDLPWWDFIIGMTFIKPQAYGARIQRRLVREFNLSAVHASADRGDFMDQFGDYWEIKVSILSREDARLNLVQIRPWQSAGYLCAAFDLRRDFSCHVFKLSHAQMVEEIGLMRATAAHGTRSANQNNANIELRMDLRIVPGDPVFDRWTAKYKCNLPGRIR